MSDLKPLANPADLATRLGATVDDPKLVLALRLASGRFRGQTNNPITLVTGDTVTLDAAGTRVLLLPATPVVNVTSVTIQGVPVEFEWSRRGAIRVDSPMPDAWGSVQVVYDHGWDPIPDDVQDVVLEQAAAIYAVLPGVISYTTGQESRSFSAALATGTSAAWSAAVAQYRIGVGDHA